jgi:hypothetical protein
MKLSQIAAKPQLIKVVLDDEITVTEFTEPLEFWTWDRQPLDTFMKLANAQQSDIASMFDIVRTLILDESGAQIITKDSVLPTGVMLRAIEKIVDALGK